MTRTRRESRERIALRRARKRCDNGDPLPFMVVLKQERDRLNIIVPVTHSRTVINVLGEGGTL